MAKLRICRSRVGVFIILLQLGFIRCQAQYVVDVIKLTLHGEEELVQKCLATGGNFGRDVSDFILTDENLGCATPVEPVDACTTVKVAANHTRTCRNPFAVVSRSKQSHPCKFSQQAFNVQNSTTDFKLVLFYNYPGVDPITMEGSDQRELVDLPVLMVSHSCMEDVVFRYPDSKSFRLRIRVDPGYYELIRYLIPFLVVICFCFALFLVTLCIRGCVERRKLNKRRLSKRNLKKIPVKKYRAGDEPDTCAICLEDFSPGEKLRHLPCRHVFHCKCIDVWLTQTRKVCPLCKRKIGSDSDSDGSNEDLRTSQSQQPATSTSDISVENLHVGHSNVPSTSRTDDFWSSQEALVDHEIMFAEQNRPHAGVGSFLRGAIRKLRSSNPETDEESGVGLENNAYHIQPQVLSSADSDHLLENEEPSSVSTSESMHDISDTSSAGSNTLSATTLMTEASGNVEDYIYH